MEQDRLPSVRRTLRDRGSREEEERAADREPTEDNIYLACSEREEQNHQREREGPL